MSSEELRQRLERFPRLYFGRYPTPLEPLTRLSRQFNGPRMWVKRDDGIGPGIGGNKGRKLEFLMADALKRGKRKVVTFGDLQSNHAQMTAAACARLGLESHLLFFARRPRQLTGNLFLNQLLGARMHFIPFGGGGEGSMTLELTNRLVRLVSAFIAGPGVYFIPVGGLGLIGCMGYVMAACELQEQIERMKLDPEKVTVVTAAGSGGTLVGLMVGFEILKSRRNVHRPGLPSLVSRRRCSADRGHLRRIGLCRPYPGIGGRHPVAGPKRGDRVGPGLYGESLFRSLGSGSHYE
jgi:L-cysteate sulfo-lyase